MAVVHWIFGLYLLLGFTVTVQSGTSSDFVCPEEFGYYPHETDCSSYYVCVFGGSLLESCSGGLMYSNELQTCDWPRNVECINGQPNRMSNVSSMQGKKENLSVEKENLNSPIEKENLNFPVEMDDSNFRSGKENLNFPPQSTMVDEIPQQRLSRSYAGSQPNFKSYGSVVISNEAPSVPNGRRVKRQMTHAQYYGYTPLTYGIYNQPQQYYDYYDDVDVTDSTQPSIGQNLANPTIGQNTINPIIYTTQPPLQLTNNDKSISSKLVQIQSPTAHDEYEDSSDYINQRYAANISNKVEQPKEYEYYYDYEETQQTITETPTTTTSTPKPQMIRHHVTQQPQAPPRRRPGSKPTLLPPANQILKGVTSNVRNIFLDSPSRLEPIYATPEPNTPATKCHRSTCVIPDCNCGGKENPGKLEPANTPQLVILTFDDSVNDLNKNLYKDLFEVGRKNPNGCPITATFYVSHEWTDYTQVQNLAADGHEIASHSVSHSFGEQFSSSKWAKEINGQREILSAYGGVKLNTIRGMRAPFLAIGGNNMFKMLYDTNFTYDSSMPVYENKPPSWPYTLDYKIFHDCMIPPCPTKSFPGIWEVPMVMWQDLKGGRCSMGDACSNPPTAQGVYEMLVKNFERHYTTNRAPFGLYYHAAWFTQPHHKEGFESFLDVLVSMDDVWLVTNWQTLQWIRNPVGINQGLLNFPPFDCRSQEFKANLPKRCASSRVCNLWHKSGVRYMKTCQNCPEAYPWTGATGV